MPSQCRRRVLVVARAVCGTCLIAPATFAAPDPSNLELRAPANAPVRQPAPPLDAAHSLVRQLGHDDFRVREEATKRLKDMGKTALPALREALTSPDPEVCSRADALVRQIERPRIPPGWFAGRNGARRVQESVANRTRLIEADEPGRKVRITHSPNGIEMTLNGVEGGEVVAMTFRARDVEDLRRQDPDAFALYQRVTNATPSPVLRGRRAPVFPMPQARVRLLPLVPEQLPVARPPADDLLNLELRLRQEMREAGVAEVEQQAVLDALRLLRDIQADGQLAPPDDLAAQIRKYNALSDALRDKLDALDLPGPGDALPPPARARLGVSVAPPEQTPGQAGVTVRMVVPDSRGEKIGLREGDVIRKVNDQPVSDAASLRRALTKEQGAVTLDIVRDGREQTLREKE